MDIKEFVAWLENLTEDAPTVIETRNFDIGHVLGNFEGFFITMKNGSKFSIVCTDISDGSEHYV